MSYYWFDHSELQRKLNRSSNIFIHENDHRLQNVGHFVLDFVLISNALRSIIYGVYATLINGYWWRRYQSGYTKNLDMPRHLRVTTQKRRHDIIWINGGLYWRISASLGPDALAMLYYTSSSSLAQLDAIIRLSIIALYDYITIPRLHCKMSQYSIMI